MLRPFADEPAERIGRRRARLRAWEGRTVQQGKLGLTCDECGAPVPGRTVPLGGCLCDDCWDEIISAELVDLVDDEPSGQQFPDGPPRGWDRV
jgi:hypothetical protein